MMFQATINVTLKKSILDPQGQTTLHALASLGFKTAKSLRIGKHFVLNLDTSNEAEAKRVVDDMCKKLLVNPVIEEYSVSLEKVDGRLQ